MRRRMGIIGVVTAALMLFVVLPYWYTHREIPTCFDGKQNQGESGIDCGSPCAVLCRGQAKDLNILWTKVFPVRVGSYDVVAYVENPNFDIGTDHFSYTATLYDADGQVIATRISNDFVLPSERFVVFAGGMLTGDKIAAKGSIEINPDFTWVTTQKTGISFSVTGKQLVNADQKPILTALLHNDTPRLYRNVDVAAIIYDSKGNPIGVSSTRVEKIDPNGEEKLSFTWPDAFDYVAETEECETPVDVMMAIDRSGSMRDEDKIGQAKLAAQQFIKRLSSNDQVGIISFASEASNPPDQTLTGESSRATRVADRIDIHTDGLQFTNIGDALRRSIDEMATLRHNKDARPIIVIMTDGVPNRPTKADGKSDETYAAKYAMQIAAEAKNDNISVYSIGLGSDLNVDLLTSIASKPEQFYQAASGADLGKVYQQIANAICKKSPSVIEIIPRVNDIVATPKAP